MKSLRFPSCFDLERVEPPPEQPGPRQLLPARWAQVPVISGVMITPSWPKINEVIKQNPGVISYKPYLYLGARNENRVLYDMTRIHSHGREVTIRWERDLLNKAAGRIIFGCGAFCGRSLNPPRPPIDGTLQRCRRIYRGKSTSAFWKLTKTFERGTTKNCLC